MKMFYADVDALRWPAVEAILKNLEMGLPEDFGNPQFSRIIMVNFKKCTAIWLITSPFSGTKPVFTTTSHFLSQLLMTMRRPLDLQQQCLVSARKIPPWYFGEDKAILALQQSHGASRF